jgi:hypothetical protein
VSSFLAVEIFAVLYLIEFLYPHSHGCNSFISLLVCKLSKGKLITYSFFHWITVYNKLRQKGGKKECKKENDVNSTAEVNIQMCVVLILHRRFFM